MWTSPSAASRRSVSLLRRPLVKLTEHACSGAETAPPTPRCPSPPRGEGPVGLEANFDSNQYESVLLPVCQSGPVPLYLHLLGDSLSLSL